MIAGAATINAVAIGITQKSKRFTDFSTASFSLASEVVESLEKMGYMMTEITIVGKKFNASKRRVTAPYHPTTALFVRRERRIVSILVYPTSSTPKMRNGILVRTISRISARSMTTLLP